MSGRLQAYLHACALALVVILTATAFVQPELVLGVGLAGAAVLLHLVLWARATSVALATRRPNAIGSLGARPFAALPLFVLLVVAFGPVPAACAGAMTAAGALLLGIAGQLQRADVREVVRHANLAAQPTGIAC